MDEVLAVGDANFQAKCLDKFLQYKKLGKTVLLVTHDISVVQQYCDRALLLRNGKVELCGDIHQVVDAYYSQSRDDQYARQKQEGENKKLRSSHSGGKSYEENVASIDSVTVISSKSGTEEVFRAGEQITVRVQHTFLKQIQNPVFGIIIRNNVGQQVFVTNTVVQGVKTGILEPGNVVVEYNFTNYFTTGTYTVSPAIAHESTTLFYDWQEEMGKFSVQSLYAAGGIIDMRHEINIKV
jgi:ABC-type glutathione transport system ATPase component